MAETEKPREEPKGKGKKQSHVWWYVAGIGGGGLVVVLVVLYLRGQASSAASSGVSAGAGNTGGSISGGAGSGTGTGTGGGLTAAIQALVSGQQQATAAQATQGQALSQAMAGLQASEASLASAISGLTPAQPTATTLPNPLTAPTPTTTALPAYSTQVGGESVYSNEPLTPGQTSTILAAFKGVPTARTSAVHAAARVSAPPSGGGLSTLASAVSHLTSVLGAEQQSMLSPGVKTSAPAKTISYGGKAYRADAYNTAYVAALKRGRLPSVATADARQAVGV